MNKKMAFTSVVTALMLPVMAFAFNPGTPPVGIAPNINGLIDTILGFIWPIAMAFFVIMFLLAAFQFATAQGDPEKVANARSFVIWGIVGVVVAILAFSIPFIVRQTLGL